MKKAIIPAALVIILALAGCASTPLSYQRYASIENLQAQALAEGTVIRCQPIHISNPIAAIAGVIGGAVLGNAVTSGHVNGTEVLVKLQDGQLLGVPEVGNPHLHPGERVAILRGANGNTRAVPLH